MDNNKKILNHINYINKSIRPFRNYVKNVQSFKFSTDVQKQIGEAMQSMQRVLEPFLEMQVNIAKLTEQLASALHLFPERLGNALLILAREGWFFDIWEMSLESLWDLEKSLEKGEQETVDKILTEHFEEKLDSIQTRVVEEFPYRKEIINQAFIAHRQGLYALTVPTLLAQLDGICVDRTEQNYFLRKNFKPNTSIYIKNIPTEGIRKVLFTPFSENLPIHASPSERKEEENFHYLNRPSVLHGEVLDYGTQVNSLKVISMINYASQMFTEEIEEE